MGKVSVCEILLDAQPGDWWKDSLDLATRQIKLLAAVLRSPIHLHYAVDLSPEGEGEGEGESEVSLGAIEQPCEIIQPSELLHAGGDATCDATGAGEDADETTRRPPLRLLHLITAKVGRGLSNNHAPLVPSLTSAPPPPCWRPQHYDLLLPSGPTP